MNETIKSHTTLCENFKKFFDSLPETTLRCEVEFFTKCAIVKYYKPNKKITTCVWFSYYGPDYNSMKTECGFNHYMSLSEKELLRSVSLFIKAYEE